MFLLPKIQEDEGFLKSRRGHEYIEHEEKKSYKIEMNILPKIKGIICNLIIEKKLKNKNFILR